MDAQSAIEATIRAIGCMALFVATAGRYRGPKKGGLLLEGALGFAVVVAVSYVLLRVR